MRSSLLLSLRLTTVASIVLVAAPSFGAQPGAGSPPEPLPAATQPTQPTQPAQPAQPAQPPAAPENAQPAPPAPPVAQAAEPEAAPPPRESRARRRAARLDAEAEEADEAERKDPDTRRKDGFRLGLDLGFERAFDGADRRLNAGTPTILPLGVDASLHAAHSFLLGIHGYAALASRDDCIQVDSCRARAYGVGLHFENWLGRGSAKFQPWVRYGFGYEMVYHGGAPLDAAGHVYRGAFDVLDLRVGGDYVVAHGEEGRSTRIGAFLGMVGGIAVSESGVSYASSGGNGSGRQLTRSSGDGHLWFVMGVRATLDP